MNKNDKYIATLYEFAALILGKDLVEIHSNDDDTRISVSIIRPKNNISVYSIKTEDGKYFLRDGWKVPPIELALDNEEVFQEYACAIMHNICKPAIISLYNNNSLDRLPNGVEASKVNISLLNIDNFTEAFNEATDEMLNGERVENVTIDFDFINEFLKIKYDVDLGRRGLHRNYYTSVTYRGNVAVGLPEAIEGGGMEENLEQRIKEIITL